MYKIIITVFLTSLLFSSCSKTKDNPQSTCKTIAISEANYKQLVSGGFSRIIESYKFVRLETSKKCLIGSVNKVITQGDKIYVLDNNITQSINVFTLKGKFIFKIQNRGKGPFEFLVIDDFYVSKEDNQIFVLDADLKKVVTYDSNGKGLSECKLSFYADHIAHLKDDLYVLLGSSKEDRVLFWDKKKNKVVKSYLKYERWDEITKPLTMYKDKVMYSRENKDTIFNITGDGLKPYWYIDFGASAPDYDRLKKDNVYMIWAFENLSMGLRRFNETGNYVNFVFDNKKKSSSPFYCFFSKKTGKLMMYTNNSLKDDVSFYPYAPQIIGSNENDEFIFPIPSIYIENSLKKIDAKSKANLTKYEKVFAKEMSGITVMDNPILVIYKMKS